MKKTAIFLIILALSCTFYTNAQADWAIMDPRVKIPAVIRSAPNYFSSIVGHIYPHGGIEYDEEKNGWLKTNEGWTLAGHFNKDPSEKEKFIEFPMPILYEILANGVPVRKTANVLNKKVGRYLNKRNIVEIIGKQGYWYKIKGEWAPDAKKGYVFHDFLKPLYP